MMIGLRESDRLAPPLPFSNPFLRLHKKTSGRERKREREQLCRTACQRSGGGSPPPPSPATLILHPQRERQQKGRSPFAAIIPPFSLPPPPARPLRPLAKIERLFLSLLSPFPFPRKVEGKISLAIHLLFFFAGALSSDFLFLFLPLF